MATREKLTGLDSAILGAVKCTICGAGYGECDCLTKCSCGWSYRKGEKCRNPKHGGKDVPLEVTHAVSKKVLP